MRDYDCAYVSSDDENRYELRIKPPQIKKFKRSHGRRSDEHKHDHIRSQKKAYHYNSAEDRYREQDYLREKLERRKRHHARDCDRKDKEERAPKQRQLRSESPYLKMSPEDRYKEQDLREKLERRKPHHVRDYDRKDKEDRNHDERRRHHRDEHTPKEKHVQSVSDDSVSPMHSESVVSDIEMSPLVLRKEYSDHEREEEIEYEEEGRQEEEEPDDSVSSSNSSSNDSINDSEIELEKDTLLSYYPAIQGSRSVEEFERLNRIGEGSYGVVYRAREKRTDRIVALKRLKMEKDKNGFPITSLREMNTLLKAQHPNIVTAQEIVVGSNMEKIFIVMEYVQQDLKSLMDTMKSKKKYFTSSEVKCLMWQLLQAVNHLHDNWILHRDLKTPNLLFSRDGVLKVGDFGQAREYGSPLKQYTPLVVTLWYRAPELLLGTKEYSTSVDVWSVGCIFAELLCMEPLFPGKTELDQVKRIFKALGTPNEKIWPEYPTLPLVVNANLPQYPPHGIRSKFVPNVLSDIGYNLLTSFLCYDPKRRITAEAALQHDYFTEHPLLSDPPSFSTWPAKDEDGRRANANSPKPPFRGQNYKEQKEDGGFYIGVGERGYHPAGFNGESTFSLKF